MRKLFTRFAALVLALIVSNNLFAGSGGPDAYGYIWKDSNEPGGPTFNWKEIQNAPGAVQITGLLDDNAVGPFNMGWDFHYYWSDFSNFKFGSNGWVGFNNIGNIAHCFPTIPQAGGNGDNYLAPFMSDLIYGAGSASQAWYWSNNTDSLIIEWVNVAWWSQTAPGYVGSNTFQLILDGTDSSITFQYKDMDQANLNNVTSCANDLEIGIENLTGNIGLEVLNETVPADSYVVKFYYPQVVTFQVPDATPAWAGNPDNAGQFVYANGTAATISANVANVGNANITGSITVAASIAGIGYTSNTSLATGLVAGDDSTVTFPALATFTSPGSYILQVTTTSGQDINPSNNQTAVEVVAVECVNDTINLGYSTGAVPDGVIAWAGGTGNEGAGIFITPPSYPATVTHVDVFIADIDQDPLAVDPYSIVIYDDNGLPGAVLDSVFVPQGQIVENAWNRVALNGTAVISAGGFYVGWIQSAGNVALGTETLAPLSRRTYEIIGGGWAPYRESTVNDFLMSAHMSTVCVVSNNRPNNANLKLVATPNPSNGNTSFNMELPTIGDMTLTMTDLQGKVVFATSKAGANAGNYSVDFDANTVPAGLYIVTLKQNGSAVNTKFVVNR